MYILYKMDRIVLILSEVLRINKEDIIDDLSMDQVVRWDSFTHMDLIASLETELNIQFAMDEIISMKDIKTIKEIARKKIQD